MDHEKPSTAQDHAPDGCPVKRSAFYVDPSAAMDFGEDFHE
jgi:hypothetical protein